MERKRKKVLSQDGDVEKEPKEMELDRKNMGSMRTSLSITRKRMINGF